MNALIEPIRTGTRVQTLADIPPGKESWVARVNAQGLLRRRLLDLGVVPGSKICTLLEGPLGGPTVFRVRDTKIALRASDAALIEVSERGIDEPASPGPPNCGAGCRTCSVQRSASGAAPPDGKAHFVVALAGNPNTGKSTVFNALTGLRQHVGNWPGKTVARAEGWWQHGDFRFQVVDLPGTYSLLSTSTDEEIARDFVVFGAPDCTVIVVDSTALERNLNLVFQILEITDRVVVCVNLLDEARAKGILIDLDGLQQRLGVPVVGTTARSGKGLDVLKEAILGIAARRIDTEPLSVPYEPELQQAIDELLPGIERAFPGLPNPRWIALRLIDAGDARLRDEIESGTLADLSGRIGEASLGGAMSPTRKLERP
ncbi:MAG: 50S ribosome-binding GTPase [Candidatus Hydrogenedentes bacterium]|nr:50S ribosome-binding GTPase [Candidatus Hydrogenedentota bacterium]